MRALDAELELLLAPPRDRPVAGPWVWLAALSLGPVELPEPGQCAAAAERVGPAHGRRQRRTVRPGDAEPH